MIKWDRSSSYSSSVSSQKVFDVPWAEEKVSLLIILGRRDSFSGPPPMHPKGLGGPLVDKLLFLASAVGPSAGRNKRNLEGRLPQCRATHSLSESLDAPLVSLCFCDGDTLSYPGGLYQPKTKPGPGFDNPPMAVQAALLGFFTFIRCKNSLITDDSGLIGENYGKRQ